jgi:UDP-2,3-diacylglucosamine pyrophosphatase LpxH
MNDKPVTLIVSDLHVGGGKQDPGDDHVYQGGEFRRFIENATDSEDGRAGRIELFINGDFLEFAQVRPEVYTLGSAEYWCTEAESVEKLDAILTGHPDIFAALQKFSERGNRVTIAAGNHDVDLYWGEVQKKIVAVAGEVNFETGRDVCERYEGRLQIGHGHMIDPANSFKNWADPFLLRKPWLGPDELRLEMCPGTLFMVKFVNELEKSYPFSDNLKPLTSLARLLLKEQKWGFAVAAWSFFSFVHRHPVKTLSVEDNSIMQMASISTQIVNELASDDGEFLVRVADVYRRYIDTAATTPEVAGHLTTEEAVTDFLNRLMVAGAEQKVWLDVFNVPGASTLSVSDDTDGNTLSIIKAALAKDKEDLRQEAERRLSEPGVEVVVFGHTHQPDLWRVREDSPGGYFNPGSWTRYVDITDMPRLKLEDLAKEEDFPYQLNYIRVEPTDTGSLKAELECFEKANGNRFSPKRPGA